MGKHHKDFFSPISHETPSNAMLDLVHFDIYGFMQIFFLGGTKYFISFIDDYFLYTYVYHLKQKFEAFVMFSACKALVKKHNDYHQSVMHQQRQGILLFCFKNIMYYSRHIAPIYNTIHP
jgi:hypothetical protein